MGRGGALGKGRWGVWRRKWWGGGGVREVSGEEGLSLIYNHPLTTDHRLGDVGLQTGSIACFYAERRRAFHSVQTKLQALVYNILPSTTAVFSYTTEFRKLSANEQFFVGDQK